MRRTVLVNIVVICSVSLIVYLPIIASMSNIRCFDERITSLLRFSKSSPALGIAETSSYSISVDSVLSDSTNNQVRVSAESICVELFVLITIAHMELLHTYTWYNIVPYYSLFLFTSCSLFFLPVINTEPTLRVRK